MNAWEEVDSDDDDGDKEKAVYAISQIPFLPYIKKRLESFQKALPVLDADFDDQQVVNKFYKPCMLSENFGKKVDWPFTILELHHVQHRLLLL